MAQGIRLGFPRDKPCGHRWRFVRTQSLTDDWRALVVRHSSCRHGGAGIDTPAASLRADLMSHQ
jgi:hypothetical protein